MSGASTVRNLCLVICGAGPAPHAATLVHLAGRHGWAVAIVATPIATTMIDTEVLTKLTGQPVRSDYRTPAAATGPRSSSADAILVAPATYNFINKLAAGINDAYALNVVAEGIGRRTPVTMLPFVNTALAARRPFQQAIESLRAEGVRIVYGPGQWQPHPPGTGDTKLATYPWHKTLEALTP